MQVAYYPEFFFFTVQSSYFRELQSFAQICACIFFGLCLLPPRPLGFSALLEHQSQNEIGDRYLGQGPDCTGHASLAKVRSFPCTGQGENPGDSTSPILRGRGKRGVGDLQSTWASYSGVGLAINSTWPYFAMVWLSRLVYLPSSNMEPVTGLLEDDRDPLVGFVGSMLDRRELAICSLFRNPGSCHSLKLRGHETRGSAYPFGSGPGRF